MENVCILLNFAVVKIHVMNKEDIMKSTSFEELLNAEYGERGTKSREKFEIEAEAFCLAECHE